MRVLVACEFSGVVRRAFRALGHDAWSCDLLPASDDEKFHLQGDALAWIADPPMGESWELLIAHPPCTYLSVSGMHRTVRGLRDPMLTDDALEFVRALLDAPVPLIAVENPVGVISTRLRKPTQIIQPYEYGHDASKRTCLWLKGLPRLVPTRYVEPRMVAGKPRWSNQTDSGQNRLGPSADRWKLRAATYEGIAAAMAQQWGTVDPAFTLRYGDIE